jgi:hypothetical protein
MPYRLWCVQHLSLNKQQGHLKNGKQAGKKKELLKTYENITKDPRDAQ